MLHSSRAALAPRAVALLSVPLLSVSLLVQGRAQAQDAPTPATAADRPTAGTADAALHAGPLLGWVAHRGAAVWVQATRPVDVQLRVWPKDAPQRAWLTPPTRAQAAEDHAVTVQLEGLEPGTRYAYEVYLEGRRVDRPYRFELATPALWRYRGPAPDLKLLLGSCAFINEPPYDRPGRAYGGDYQVFEAMADVPADAMLWLGDNVYLREVDLDHPAGISARYRHVRGLPELQRLFAAMPQIATWDDHDFGPNDSDRTFPLRGTALEVFQRYWPAVQYGLPEVPGVFQKRELGDVDLFVLDDRYHRDPNRWPNGPEKQALGAAQVAWLQGALVSSRATFKLIACGNQVLNHVTPYESLSATFPHEAQRLLEWIAAQQIDGVVFLSGDRHHTELLKVERPGTYPLYEFTSSPLTSSSYTIQPGHPEYDNPLRVPGTLLGERSFGMLEVKGEYKDRRLVFEARAQDGTSRWRHEVRESELRSPRVAPGAPPVNTPRPSGKLY